MNERRMNTFNILMILGALFIVATTLVYDSSYIFGFEPAFILFVTFTLTFLLQIFIGNNGTLIAMTILSLMIELEQILSGNILETNSVLPYSFVCALVLLIVGFRDSKKNYIYSGFCQFAMEGAILFFAYFEEEMSLWKTMLDLTPIFVWFAILLFMISFYFSKKSTQNVLRSFGVLNIVLAINTSTLNYFNVPEFLFAEWFTLSLLIGIVILTIIWYSENNVTSQIRIIGFNLITLYLLSHNIEGNTELFCAITFTIYVTTISLYGILHNQKSFLFVGVASLAIHSIHMSLEFWMLVPLWGYFLLAGILLTVIAILFEKREKNITLTTTLKEEL